MPNCFTLTPKGVSQLPESLQSTDPPAPAPTDAALFFPSGMLVIYAGNADDVWTIVKHLPDGKYAYCSKGGMDRDGKPKGKAKNIVAALLSPVPDRKPPRARSGGTPAPRREKKRKDNIGDAISTLLAEAETLEQLWEIAQAAGMDVAAVKVRIGHLNPGLQRMGIGNRLRSMQRHGKMNEVALRWTPKGLKPID